MFVIITFYFVFQLIYFFFSFIFLHGTSVLFFFGVLPCSSFVFSLLQVFVVKDRFFFFSIMVLEFFFRRVLLRPLIFFPHLSLNRFAFQTLLVSFLVFAE